MIAAVHHKVTISRTNASALNPNLSKTKSAGTFNFISGSSIINECISFIVIASTAFLKKLK